MSGYPSEDELRDLAHRVQEAYVALGETGDERSGRGGPVVPLGYDAPSEADPVSIAGRPVDADVEPFLDLDPVLVAEQHENMERARAKVGSDTVSALLDQIQFGLNDDWTGEGALAFQRQATAMRGFAEGQRRDIEDLQKSLVAGASLAITAREDYVRFGEAMLEACRQYEEQQQAEQRQVQLLMLAGIVGGVLSLPSGAMVGWVLGAGAIVASGLITGAAGIGGSSLVDLAESYRDAYRRLVEAFEADVAELTAANFALRQEILDAPPKLYEPLPAASTDVHSPDFRYDSFMSDWQPPEGPFVDGVASQQRPETVEQDSSPIRDALG